MSIAVQLFIIKNTLTFLWVHDRVWRWLMHFEMYWTSSCFWKYWLDINTVPHWVLFILTVYAFWIFQHSFTPVITAFDRLCKKRFPFQWFILNCLVKLFTFYPLCNLTHQETKYMFVIRYRSVTYRRSHNYIISIPRI